MTVLFADLVAATAAVAATASRKDKTAALADLIASAAPDDVPMIIGLVSGDPRQGRIGIGWSTVASLDTAPAEVPSLTIGDVDAMLTEVAGIHGPGSQERRRDALSAVLADATGAEADFIRRLLVGELRQGANAGIVADAVAEATGVPAPALRRAVMMSGDLGLASEIAIRDGRPGLDAVGLEVGRPIQPMLASTAPDVESAVEGMGRVSVEWKLDGIRIQVHRDGEDIGVWTRNLNEITDRMPTVVAVVRSLDVDRVVLDGEVLGIDEDGRPLAFQDTVSNDTLGTPFFFDLLHHDGEDLVDTPLLERRARLRTLVGSHAVPGMITEDPDVAREVLDEALSRGHEGVVIKDASSIYQAGRRGKAWRKVKPVHTLDLVVLAVEYGSGRRRSWLSNIHLGARDPSDGSLVMVGKTFKGMTDEMLVWQTDRFRGLATADDGRVVTVRPEQVVEIAVDGVQASTRYPGGVALRFARVVRYREDKTAQEIDTIDTVRGL
jgi:DNA ligase-1